jgi:hypothetical protein
MPNVIQADVDALFRLRVGLVQSSNKYASEANLLKSAADTIEQASDTNSHAAVAEQAIEIARKLETIGAAIGAVADGLTPEIERLAALTDLTRRS